jgi:hypothetical protein
VGTELVHGDMAKKWPDDPFDVAAVAVARAVFKVDLAEPSSRACKSDGGSPGPDRRTPLVP